MIEVQEINRIDALGEFRSDWHDLLDRTPGGSFFHTLQWLESYWDHFGAGQRLRVLVAIENRRPIGILPLAIRTERTRIGRVRVLVYPLHDWGTFYGPIGPNPTATLVHCLRHLRHTPRDWDVLDLRWVDHEGADLGRTERAMVQSGFRPCPQKWDCTSLVELPDEWSDYWRERDPRFHKNLDRVERRMLEKGSLELVRFRPSSLASDDDPRWDLYEACSSLAQKSWQGESGDKTNLCHAEVAGYFRQAHLAAARLGAIDLNLLLFNGQAVAFAYNYIWRGEVYGVRKGFDPEFRHLRPGLILQKKMLEDGLHRGDRIYDLGTGSHEAKKPWRTSVRAAFRFTYFPATVLRAQLLWWNRWLRRKIRGEHDMACSQVV